MSSTIPTRRLRRALVRSMTIAAALLVLAPTAALAEIYVTVIGAGSVRVTKGSASNVVMTCESAPTTPTGRRGADCQTGAGMFESIGVHVTPAPGYSFAGFQGTSSHCNGQLTTCWYVASGIASDFFYPTFVDTTAPAATITSGPPSLTSSNEARFEFHADQAGSTFECQPDAGAWGACASGHARSGLGDGEHTMRVRAIDPSGNVQQVPAARTWTVDRIAPAVRILSGPAAPVRERATFWITYEPGARVECRSYAIGGVVDPWSNCTAASIVASAVHEGSQSFELRATDAAGNVSNVIRQVWISDVTAPTVTFEAAPAQDVLITSRSTTITWGVRDATTVTSTCRVDDELRDCAATSMTLTGLADGTHHVAVTVRDGAGNETIVARQFSVDATAPAATITDGPVGETIERTATFGWSVRTPENGVTFRCSLDAGAWTACQSPLLLRDLAVGTHELRVVASDRFGNEQSPANAAQRSWTVTVPTPVPTPDPTQQPVPSPAPGSGADANAGGDPGPEVPVPAPAPDRTAPALQVRVAPRVSVGRTGQLLLHVTCSERCTIAASGSARVGRARPLRLTARTMTASANVRTTLRIAITPAVRRAVQTARSGAIVRATLAVTARDGAGNIARRTVRVLLVR